MNQTRAVAVVTTLVALLAAACANDSPTTTLVLLDGSCSRVNLGAYQDAWAKITAGVAEGDRLVLGRITSDVREFRPDLDVERPAAWPLLDNTLDREDRAKAFHAQVTEALQKALDVPCSQRTAILDTVDVAARLLATDVRSRRRLVVLSDMLEDSYVARFDRGLTARQATHLLDGRRKSASLPDLSGVQVHVVGAAAPSTALMREVHRFWVGYFAAAGASLTPERYGPMLFGL